MIAIAFAAGAFIGALMGVVAMALAQISGKDDRDEVV